MMTGQEKREGAEEEDGGRRAGVESSRQSKDRRGGVSVTLSVIHFFTAVREKTDPGLTHTHSAVSQ